MIPHESFKNLGSNIYKPSSRETDSISKIDWTSLTNTEKMVKALIIKAQWAAKLNAFLD